MRNGTHPPPAPVDLTEDEDIPAVNIDELFGPDARPRSPGKQRPRKKTKSDTSVSTGGSSSSSQLGEIMTNELRLKREAAEAAFEVAKQKDRTVMRLEEIKFLAISTKDLSEDDASFIEEQKREVRARYNLYRNPESNPRRGILRVCLVASIWKRFEATSDKRLKQCLFGNEELTVESCVTAIIQKASSRII
ncbi:hypothetical protein Tco_0925780 [Tanacetum coccineum]|uniref:Uncharacterized protein n=1 Tax=Tanacetum coccineum TaxID=301880 RepID=A0ABQ5D7U8_9ASTR